MHTRRKNIRGHNNILGMFPPLNSKYYYLFTLHTLYIYEDIKHFYRKRIHVINNMRETHIFFICMITFKLYTTIMCFKPKNSQCEKTSMK